MLANNLANYLAMYDIATGVTNLSNALNAQIANHQRAAETANQQDATSRYNATMSTIGQALGAVGGAATGGYTQGLGLAKGLSKAGQTTTSDIRLKENIEKLDTVDGINIYKFDYIDGEKDQVGVIAQEMQEKCPECVLEKDGYLAVNYTKLPQEVQDRIEELK